MELIVMDIDLHVFVVSIKKFKIINCYIIVEERLEKINEQRILMNFITISYYNAWEKLKQQQ